jgi:hypothetical protein
VLVFLLELRENSPLCIRLESRPNSDFADDDGAEGMWSPQRSSCRECSKAEL